MTNYDKIMSEMTIEKMELKNVRYMRSCESWATSMGRMHEQRADAVHCEMRWLKSEVEHE